MDPPRMEAMDGSMDHPEMEDPWVSLGWGNIFYEWAGDKAGDCKGRIRWGQGREEREMGKWYGSISVNTIKRYITLQATCEVQSRNM